MAEADLMRRLQKVASKDCTICGRGLPIDSFPKNKLGKHGVGSWCLSCFAARQREKHHESKAGENARSLAWYHANKERVAKQRRKKRDQNPEKFRVLDAAARKRRTPEKAKEYDARKRAKRLAALTCDDASFTSDEWQAVMREHDYRCAYCGKRTFLTQDHVTPLSRGGKHARFNILPACGPCNSSKNASTLDEWMLRYVVACDV